jgi:hypothetical protein
MSDDGDDDLNPSHPVKSVFPPDAFTRAAGRWPRRPESAHEMTGRRSSAVRSLEHGKGPASVETVEQQTLG